MGNILVLEDQKMLRMILCDMLKENNYTVVEAEDGMEGLNLIESNDVSLVITDIMMPNYDGVSFLEMATSLHPEIKFMVATSLKASDELYIQAKDIVGKGNMLKKPVCEEEVISKVKNLML